MFLKIFFIAFPVFLVIDMVWLGIAAKDFYQKQIGSLMKASPNWTAAIIFYALFIGGLTIFVIKPALAKNSWSQAVLMGALFGLITYATYDLTNLATLKNWPLTLTIVDLLWGAGVAASVSAITYFIISKFGL